MDPFDGGPHLGCPTEEVSLIQKGKYYDWEQSSDVQFECEALISVNRKGTFWGGSTPLCIKKNLVYLPKRVKKVLQLEAGEKVYVSPLD